MTNNRSPSPISSKNLNNSETRKSFSGSNNSFAKPSLLANHKRLDPITPSNSPSDFSRRWSVEKDKDWDEKENEKIYYLKASKLRSPAKNSKNFMSPTISAASKFASSPKKKILVERNDPLRTSISLCNGKVSFFSLINVQDLDANSDIESDQNQTNVTSLDLNEKKEAACEGPLVSKPPKRVTFSDLPSNYNPTSESIITDSDDNLKIESGLKNKVASSLVSSCEGPLVSKPPKRVTFSDLPSNYNPTSESIITDSDDNLKIESGLKNKVASSLVSSCEGPLVSKPPKRVTFSDLPSNYNPTSESIITDSDDNLKIESGLKNKVASSLVSSCEGPLVSKPPKRVTFSDLPSNYNPTSESIITDSDDNLKIESGLKNKVTSSLVSSCEGPLVSKPPKRVTFSDLPSNYNPTSESIITDSDDNLKIESGLKNKVASSLVSSCEGPLVSKPPKRVTFSDLPSNYNPTSESIITDSDDNLKIESGLKNKVASSLVSSCEGPLVSKPPKRVTFSDLPSNYNPTSESIITDSDDNLKIESGLKNKVASSLVSSCEGPLVSKPPKRVTFSDLPSNYNPTSESIITDSDDNLKIESGFKNKVASSLVSSCEGPLVSKPPKRVTFSDLPSNYNPTSESIITDSDDILKIESGLKNKVASSLVSSCEGPLVSKPPKRVTFSDLPSNYNPTSESIITDSNDNLKIESGLKNKVASSLVSSCEGPLVSKPPKRVTFSDLPSNYNPTSESIITDSDDNLKIESGLKNKVASSLVSSCEGPLVSKPPKRVTFSDLPSNYNPTSESIITDSDDNLKIESGLKNKVASSLVSSCEGPLVSKPPKRVTFSDLPSNYNPTSESIITDSDDNLKIESGLKNKVASSLVSSCVAFPNPDSSLRPYDPKTNYLSPRPQFLHYKPNPRIGILFNKEKLEDDFLEEIMCGTFSDSESTEESSQSEFSQMEEAEITDRHDIVNGIDKIEEYTCVLESFESSTVSNAAYSDNFALKKEKKSRGFFKVACFSILLMFLTVCVSVFVARSDQFACSGMSFSDVSSYYHELKFSASEKTSFEKLARHVNEFSDNAVAVMSKLIGKHGKAEKIGPLKFMNVSELQMSIWNEDHFGNNPIGKKLAVYDLEQEDKVEEDLNAETYGFEQEVDSTESSEMEFVENLEEDDELEEDLNVETCGIEQEVDSTESSEMEFVENLEDDELENGITEIEDESLINITADNDGNTEMEEESLVKVTSDDELSDLVKVTDSESENSVFVENTTDEITFQAETVDVADEITKAAEIESIEKATMLDKENTLDSHISSEASQSSLKNESPIDKTENKLPHYIIGFFSLFGALLGVAALVYNLKRSHKSGNIVVEKKPLLREQIHQEKQISKKLQQEVEGPCSSEMSSFNSAVYGKKVLRGESEAQSFEGKPRRYSKRESLASSSMEYSTGALSYGSFTTFESIPVGEVEIITPVRRSSRLRRQVTSP